MVKPKLPRKGGETMQKEAKTMQTMNFTGYYSRLKAKVSRPKIEWKRFKPAKIRRAKKYDGVAMLEEFAYYPSVVFIGVGEIIPVFYNRLLAILFIVGPYVFSHLARTWQLVRILKLKNRDFEFLLGWLAEKRSKIYRPVNYIGKILKEGKASMENPEYYIKRFNYIISSYEFMLWSQQVLEALAEIDYNKHIRKPAEIEASGAVMLKQEEYNEALVRKYIKRVTLERLRATPYIVQQGRLHFDDHPGLAKLILNAVVFNVCKNRLKLEDFQQTSRLMKEYYQDYVVFWKEQYNGSYVEYHMPSAHSAWRLIKISPNWLVLHLAHFVHPYDPASLSRPHKFILALLDYLYKFDNSFLKKVSYFAMKLIVKVVSHMIRPKPARFKPTAPFIAHEPQAFT